jgi:hypothetical protein
LIWPELFGDRVCGDASAWAGDELLEQEEGFAAVAPFGVGNAAPAAVQLERAEDVDAEGHIWWNELGRRIHVVPARRGRNFFAAPP